jgi:predicted nucleic acid-binding protein
MILADTSVGVDHFRSSDAELQVLLERREVLIHPFIIGEISLSNLAQHDLVMRSMARLPKAASFDDNILYFIGQHGLHGTGIGYVDAHLLASALLTAATLLWTRDKRLAKVAGALGIAPWLLTLTYSDRPAPRRPAAAPS